MDSQRRRKVEKQLDDSNHLLEPTTLRQKIGYIFFKWGFASIGYFVIPTLAVFTVVVSEPSLVDGMIPLLPWTVTVYLWLFIHVVICMWVTQNLLSLRVITTMYVLSSLGLFSFYFFVPIQMPMDPIDAEDMFAWLLQFVRDNDVAVNALPSGHVLYSLMGPIYLISVGQKSKDKRNYLLLFIGILVSLSTLTTKQHHLRDLVVAGVLSLIIAIPCGVCTRLYIKMAGYEEELKQRGRKRRGMKIIWRKFKKKFPQPSKKYK